MARLRGIITALFISVAPAAASADAPPQTLIGAQEDGRRWLTLQLEYNGNWVSDSRMSLERHDAALGAAFYPLPWLNVFTKVHFGRTAFAFHYAFAKGYDLASGVSNDDVSLEAGLHLGVMTWKRLSLDVFGSFEIMPYQPRFRIESAKMSTPFGPFDCTEYCGKHADFRYDISRLNAGAALHVRLWRFVPRLAVQYQRLSATFDPRLDEEAAATIGLFGFDPKKAKQDLSGVKHVPAISPGLYVDLPLGFGLDAQIDLVPTGSSTFLTFRSGLSWSY